MNKTMSKTKQLIRRTITPTLLFALTILAVTTARADKKADALLRQVAAATATARVLTADIEQNAVVDGKRVTRKGRLTFMRPNFARIEFPGKNGYTFVSDGSHCWDYRHGINSYYKGEAQPDGGNIVGLPPFSKIFFHPSVAVLGMFPTETLDNAKNGKLLRAPIPAKTRYVGTKTWRGRRFQVVDITRNKPFPHVTRVYIGPDYLLHRPRW